jgi:hypothetical protein
MNVFLIAAVLAAAPPFTAETLTGQSVAGNVTALDSQRLTLQTPGGPVTLETGRLIRLTPQQTPSLSDEPPAAWVELADGSFLVAADFSVSGGRARLTFSDDQTVELPAAGIARVRFQESGSAVAEWERVCGIAHTGDVLVVRKDEVLDYHHGVLGDVTDAAVHFQIDGQKFEVKRPKVFGIIYHRRPTEAPQDAVCELGDVTRSRWRVRSLSTPGEANLQWTTPAGATMTRPLAMVTQIDFSRGKVVYLSDLTEESLTFSPYFGTEKGLLVLRRFLAPRKDMNLQSGPLQIAKKQYGKGLAIHSRTEIVYRLPGSFRRFCAVAGIDDAVRPHGNVRLVISGDGKRLLETTVAGSDASHPEGPPPLPIELDVSGVRRLSVLVDFGAEMDMSDHLDLCEARVIQ